MRETEQFRSTAFEAHRAPSDDTEALSARIRAIAETGRIALGAAACATVWRGGGFKGRAVAAASDADAARADAIALIAAIEESEANPETGAGAIILDGATLDTLLPPASSIARAVAIFGDGASIVRIGVAGIASAAPVKSKAILELIGDALLAEIAAGEARRSRAFWRDKAADSLARQSAGREPEHREIDRMAVRLARTSGADRMHRLGSSVARLLGATRWIVATLSDGHLTVVAHWRDDVRTMQAAVPRAIAECFERGCIVDGNGDADNDKPASSDDAPGDAWIAIPVPPGVIAIGASMITDALRSTIEAVAARVAPIFRAWIAEDELDASRTLARRLALRMYAAIDDERARIARDLHDDHAQMLAAARIAIQGGGARAGAILKRIDDDLRERIRELRPASLGRAGLGDAIEAELVRLRVVGIAAEMVSRRGLSRISRPIQEVCFQVAREALANAARHSGAHSVKVEIARTGSVVRMTVRDDGHGVAAPPNSGQSAGIAGMRERLTMLGGRLDVESGPSGTVVIAEVPEIA